MSPCCTIIVGVGVLDFTCDDDFFTCGLVVDVDSTARDGVVKVDVLAFTCDGTS